MWLGARHRVGRRRGGRVLPRDPGLGPRRLEDGTTVQLNYSASNGHPYTAIGRVLIDRGAIERSTVSLQTIRAWLAAHPREAQSVMRTPTRRTCSFARALAIEAHGAEGVVLTRAAAWRRIPESSRAGRSAVSRRRGARRGGADSQARGRAGHGRRDPRGDSRRSVLGRRARSVRPRRTHAAARARSGRRSTADRARASRSSSVAPPRREW